jgi:Spy/CpxP family protein refolding chaperone
MAVPPLTCPECGAEFQWGGANPHYNRARHVESAHLSNGGKPIHWSFDRETAPWYYKKEHGWKESSEGIGTSPREDINDSARFNAKHRAFFEAEADEAIRHAHGERRSERSAPSSHPTDTRSKREKLEAMANQTASPREAEVARHLLFKRYGRRYPRFNGAIRRKRG